MHEMSLAEAVLQQVEATARREQAQRVTRIILEIGELASVEVDALIFCFDAASRSTLAEDAKLEITLIEGHGHCQACGKEQAIHAFGQACAACSSYRLEATTGTEMRVREIEII